MYKTDLRNMIVTVLEKEGTNECEYYMLLVFLTCFVGLKKWNRIKFKKLPGNTKEKLLSILNGIMLRYSETFINLYKGRIAKIKEWKLEKS